MGFFVTFVDILCTILIFAIIIRAILSWFPASQGSQFAIFLNQITDPILKPLRGFIPLIGGTIDITPIVAIILLNIIQWLVRLI